MVENISEKDIKKFIEIKKQKISKYMLKDILKKMPEKKVRKIIKKKSEEIW